MKMDKTMAMVTVKTTIMVIILMVAFVCVCVCVGGPNKGDVFLCEDVGVERCAFGVSTQGERCVLETNILKDGSIQLECQVCNVM